MKWPPWSRPPEVRSSSYTDQVVASDPFERKRGE